MDFDADGHDDLISGSYDPGEMYLFRGEGGGKFKARETLMDKSGKPILRKPDQEHPVESFGSWPAMVDWDNDGDLDLIYGGFDGTLTLRVNEGSRALPVFSTSNTPVNAGGEPVKILEGHCTPVVVDWDGDGRWDLLSGGADGAVFWFRNVGEADRPEFAKALAIVPKHEGNGYSEVLGAGEAPRPGIRSQIAVADWNGDGKPDLLLGDFQTNLEIRDDLPPAEKAEAAKLKGELDELAPKLTASNVRNQEEFQRFWKDYGIKEQFTPEVQAKYRKLSEEIRARPEVKALSDRNAALTSALKPFLKPVGPGTLGGGGDTPHGYVWLYLRN